MIDHIKNYFQSVCEAYRLGNVETSYNAPSPSPLFKGGGMSVASDGGLLPADGGLAFLQRNKELRQPSRDLRTDATKQENHIWYDFLRDFRPRFTRQRIVNNYILDFFCHEAMLAVELDGSQHYEPEAVEYDKTRTDYLNELGVEVIRFDNREIDKNFDEVCALIAKAVDERTGKPPPPVGGTTFEKGAASETQLPTNIYLTNTLSPPHSSFERSDQLSLFDFSAAITDEAYNADTRKTRRPIKVIIGNPPYLAASTNPFDMSAYKTETDGTKFNERNSKLLGDDYVKFFRFAEQIINANNEGILAFVSKTYA